MNNPIYEITGGRFLDEWTSLNPIVFYKGGNPYGLIGVSKFRNGFLISSCSKDNQKFTRAMIRYMSVISKLGTIYIIHSKEAGYIYESVLGTYRKRFRVKKLLLEEHIIIVGRMR